MDVFKLKQLFIPISFLFFVYEKLNVYIQFILFHKIDKINLFCFTKLILFAISLNKKWMLQSSLILEIII